MARPRQAVRTVNSRVIQVNNGGEKRLLVRAEHAIHDSPLVFDSLFLVFPTHQIISHIHSYRHDGHLRAPLYLSIHLPPAFLRLLLCKSFISSHPRHLRYPVIALYVGLSFLPASLLAHHHLRTALSCMAQLLLLLFAITLSCTLVLNLD